MIRQLDEMVKLSQVALDRALASLTELTREMQALEVAKSKHLAAVQSRSHELGVADENDRALWAGRDTQWRDWVQKQIGDLNAELARLRVEQESRKADARLAFGKREAAVMLQDRARGELKKTRARRQA